MVGIKLEPTVQIYTNLQLNTVNDNLCYYQNTLPPPSPNAEFTRRL